jgi:ABC-type spermidine/putrescine transport system permease subunit I
VHHQSREADTDDQSKGCKPKRATDDEPKHASAVRSQGHPNANLTQALLKNPHVEVRRRAAEALANIGEPAKVVILFYASFFAGVIVMYEGISQINPIFIRVANTLGATDGEIFRRVIVPLSLPHVITALRVSLGVAWATLDLAEPQTAGGPSGP